MSDSIRASACDSVPQQQPPQPDLHQWTSDSNATTVACKTSSDKTSAAQVTSGDTHSDPFADARLERGPACFSKKSADGSTTNNYFVNGDLYINEGGNQTIEKKGVENHTVVKQEHHEHHEQHHHHKHKPAEKHAQVGGHKTEAVHHADAPVHHAATQAHEGQCLPTHRPTPEIQSRVPAPAPHEQYHQADQDRAMVNAYRRAQAPDGVCTTDNQSYNPTPGNYYDRSNGGAESQYQTPKSYQNYDYYNYSGDQSGDYPQQGYSRQSHSDQRYESSQQYSDQQYCEQQQYESQQRHSSQQYDYQQQYPNQRYENQQPYPNGYDYPQQYPQYEQYGPRPCPPQQYEPGYATPYPVAEYPQYYPAPHRHHGFGVGINIGGLSIGVGGGFRHHNYGYSYGGYENYGYPPAPPPSFRFNDYGYGY